RSRRRRCGTLRLCGSRMSDRQAAVVRADRVADLAIELHDDARDTFLVLAATNLLQRRRGDVQWPLSPREIRVLEVDHEAVRRADQVSLIFRGTRGLDEDSDRVGVRRNGDADEPG